MEKGRRLWLLNSERNRSRDLLVAVERKEKGNREGRLLEGDCCWLWIGHKWNACCFDLLVGEKKEQKRMQVCNYGFGGAQDKGEFL
jgi:hypothetical protein